MCRGKMGFPRAEAWGCAYHAPPGATLVPQSGIRVLLRSFAILTSHTIKMEWHFGIDIYYMYICRCEKDVAT